MSGLVRENFLGGKQSIERGRETGIDGHLHDDLYDFIPAQPNIQAGLDMHLQLGGSIAHRRQRPDGGDLTGAQVEAWTTVDIAKRKLEHVSCKVRRDIRKRSDNLLSGRAVDLSERAPPAFQPAFADVLGVLRHSP